jgi:hypothetical protein
VVLVSVVVVRGSSLLERDTSICVCAASGVSLGALQTLRCCDVIASGFCPCREAHTRQACWATRLPPQHPSIHPIKLIHHERTSTPLLSLSLPLTMPLAAVYFSGPWFAALLELQELRVVPFRPADIPRILNRRNVSHPAHMSDFRRMQVCV